MAKGEDAGLAIPNAIGLGVRGTQGDGADDGACAFGDERESGMEPAGGGGIILMGGEIAETHCGKRRVGGMEQGGDFPDGNLLAKRTNFDGRVHGFRRNGRSDKRQEFAAGKRAEAPISSYSLISLRTDRERRASGAGWGWGRGS